MWFLLVWKEIIITIIMSQEVKGNTIKWKLGSLTIHSNDSLNKESVLCELCEAMKAYGYSGFSYFEPIKAEIEIDF